MRGFGMSPISSPSGTPSIFGFCFMPSYQYRVTGGMEPRAGNSNLMVELFGNMKLLAPSFLMHSTLVGAPSFKAIFGAPRMWQAISPRAPQPKSKKPRQLNG